MEAHGDIHGVADEDTLFQEYFANFRISEISLHELAVNVGIHGFVNL